MVVESQLQSDRYLLPARFLLSYALADQVSSMHHESGSTGLEVEDSGLLPLKSFAADKI